MSAIKVGDYRALAKLEGVPGIQPAITQREAARRLINHLAEHILQRYGRTTGWTEEEYRQRCRQHADQ